MKKALTLSLIIPVYNEERRLKACLDAIAGQTVAPNEVIVVDNNSTDDSMVIAQKYPFVRIVTEKKQGFTHARNAGFAAAKSDILGRIDCDSIVAENWVEIVLENFSADPELSGLTGLGSADVLPRIKIFKTVLWSWFYFVWVRVLFRLPIMWGANMAIRRSVWSDIKDEVIMDDRLVHEDQDMSLCILEHGGKIAKDNRLRITTGGQTYHYFPKLVAYTRRMYTTKSQHRARHAYQSLQRNMPLPLAAVIWFFPGIPIFVFFFSVSLLLFPIDYILKKLNLADAWLD